VIGGGVAASHRGPGMGGLVQHSGEQEDEVEYDRVQGSIILRGRSSACPLHPVAQSVELRDQQIPVIALDLD
jgi:hypothetical protein